MRCVASPTPLAHISLTPECEHATREPPRLSRNLRDSGGKRHRRNPSCDPARLCPGQAACPSIQTARRVWARKGKDHGLRLWNDELGHSQCRRRNHLRQRHGLCGRWKRHHLRPWRRRHPLRRGRPRHDLRGRSTAARTTTASSAATRTTTCSARGATTSSTARTTTITSTAAPAPTGSMASTASIPCPITARTRACTSRSIPSIWSAAGTGRRRRGRYALQYREPVRLEI